LVIIYNKISFDKVTARQSSLRNRNEMKILRFAHKKKLLQKERRKYEGELPSCTKFTPDLTKFHLSVPVFDDEHAQTGSRFLITQTVSRTFRYIVLKGHEQCFCLITECYRYKRGNGMAPVSMANNNTTIIYATGAYF
jgi:hypothetical protein